MRTPSLAIVLAAAAALAKLESGPEKARLVGAIAQEWARNDPEAALEWVQSALTGASQTKAVGEVARQLIANDSSVASSLIELMPFGDKREHH